MKRKKKLQPLQKQLVHLLLIFVICVLSIIVWSISDYIKLQNKNLENTLELYAGHLAQTARQSYTSYENIAYSVAYNTLVQDYIQENDSVKRYEAYQQVYNLLSNTSKLNSYLADITIIGSDGNSISLTASPSLYDCYEDVLSTPSYAFCSMGTLNIRGTNCHILSMPVHKLSSSGRSRYLGTVFLAINSEHFFAASIADERNENIPKVLLVDESGRTVYGDESLLPDLIDHTDNTVFRVTAEDKVYEARMYTISESGSRLYVLFDTSYYTTASVQIAVRLGIGILVAMFFVLICFVHVCFPVSTSLRNLTGVMEHITEGGQSAIKKGIDLTNVRYSCSEIQDIYKAFSDMINEINRLNHTIFNTYTQMYELEMNNRQTEIAFLRSQINPHFLYNTLTTICGMAASNMNDQIINVTNALSQIFRYSIRGGDMVSFSEELDIVRSYVMIQSCRFEDRFSVEYQIQENTLNCQIPKMIIQPLVENAIVHGLEPSLKSGRLIISTSLDTKKNLLTISVMDTGVGMSAKKLQQLKTILKESMQNKSNNAQTNIQAFDAKAHDSIGIFNVNSRIVLYYGEQYALKLDSWEGFGTNMQICIPAQWN